MRDERDDDLNPEEMRALAALRRSTSPPPDLEERVVAELTARGAIRGGSPWRRVAAAAALILAAALGYAVGSRGTAPAAVDQAATGAGGARTFALLVYDPAAGLPAARVQDAVAEATAWASRLAEDGTLVYAEKLHDEGRRLVSRDGEVRLVAEFPPSGEALVLGGFFMVRARSFDEAQRIAAECPLLRYGSTIEIRAFEEL